MQNQCIKQVTHFANMFYFTKGLASRILGINMSLFWWNFSNCSVRQDSQFRRMNWSATYSVLLYIKAMSQKQGNLTIKSQEFGQIIQRPWQDPGN